MDQGKLSSLPVAQNWTLLIETIMKDLKTCFATARLSWVPPLAYYRQGDAVQSQLDLSAVALTSKQPISVDSHNNSLDISHSKDAPRLFSKMKRPPFRPV